MLTTGSEGGEQKLQMVQKTLPMHGTQTIVTTTSGTPKSSLKIGAEEVVNLAEFDLRRASTENMMVNEQVIKVIKERKESSEN